MLFLTTHQNHISHVIFAAKFLTFDQSTVKFGPISLDNYYDVYYTIACKQENESKMIIRLELLLDITRFNYPEN